MARIELPNGVILPAEYSDDWYEDMTSNLTKLDDVIGSDSEKLNADGVDFLRMSSAALTDGGTGNFSDLNSSYKIKTGDFVLDSGRKLYQVVSVDSTNERFTVGNSLFKVTAESDLAPVAESGDYDDLDNKPDLNPYDQHLANTEIHVTTADKNRWNNNTYVFRYSSTTLVALSTNSNTLLDNADNLKVGDKVIDSSGVLFSITAIDTQNSTFTIGTALIDLAQDSDVVHNTGDENVNGIKTFKDMIPIDGDYLGNEASTNQRTNICLRSNRDTADKSCAYITRFRQNRAQGALQYADLQKIGFDVLENEVRTNNVFDIQCTNWLNDVPQRVNLVSSAQSYSYGSPTNKALINDLNPGSLSFPDLSNGIDISSYITLNSDSSYTPLSNGYVYICCYSSSACGLWVRDTNNNGVSTRSIGSVPTYNNLVSIYIPVVKNVSLSIFTPGCENILTAKFYPCQGNV